MPTGEPHRYKIYPQGKRMGLLQNAILQKLPIIKVRFYVNSWGGAKNEIIIGRVGAKAPVRFLLIIEPLFCLDAQNILFFSRAENGDLRQKILEYYSNWV